MYNLYYPLSNGEYTLIISSQNLEDINSKIIQDSAQHFQIEQVLIDCTKIIEVK
jgi:hypothetical protein